MENYMVRRMKMYFLVHLGSLCFHCSRFRFWVWFGLGGSCRTWLWFRFRFWFDQDISLLCLRHRCNRFIATGLITCATRCNPLGLFQFRSGGLVSCWLLVVRLNSPQTQNSAELSNGLGWMGHISIQRQRLAYSRQPPMLPHVQLLYRIFKP